MNFLPAIQSGRIGPSRWGKVCVLWLWFVCLISTTVRAALFTHDPPGHLTSITSAPASAPNIIGQPLSQVISENGTVYFNVAAGGTGPFSYQWLSNGVPITGAIGDTLAFTNVIVPQNLVSNGGFELPVIQSPYVTYPVGNGIDSWTIESGSADLVKAAYWQQFEGVQSMDLNGAATGTIYQDVPTVPGKSYYLHFALAGNYVVAPVIKTNQVWWNGSLLDTVTFNTTGHSSTDMGWTNREYLVAATATTTRIRFVSLVSSGGGSVLDGVSLLPVPPAPAEYRVIVSNASGSVTSSVVTIQFDSDHNGLPDDWERQNFGGIGQLADADADSDGISNGDEFLDGTDPGNAASYRPRLSYSSTVGGAAQVSPVRPSYTLNEPVQITAVPDTGYFFDGWSGSVTTNTALLNLTMDSSKSLRAVFGRTLVNGINHFGTVKLGETNLHALTANAGDTIILRCGKVSGTASFAPRIQIYGTNSTPLATAQDDNDAYAAYRTTNSGTFRVLVSSYYAGNSGDYRLTLAQSPGTFIVPAGDDGGSLTNGAAHLGTTELGDEDLWSFTAGKDDTVLLRAGKTSGSASYAPYVRLYATNGALLAWATDYNDSYVAVRLTNSGTFNVVIGSYYAGYTGTYQLQFAKSPGAFVVPPGDEGGPLTNGARHDGISTMGDEDLWNFTASAGDSVILRAGKVSGSASYAPYLRLYGTNGALLASDADYNDSYVTFRLTNSGTFNVAVGSYNAGYTGAYQLQFAKSPGTFVVPPGDEGGPLTNGGNHDGTTTMGDEDMWSFNGNAGDTVVLRAGKTSGAASFAPYIRLYGTNGVLLASDADVNDSYTTFRLTNSGTFNVVVGAYIGSYAGYTGTYRLRLAQIPGAFTVPSGDEGGLLAPRTNYDGTNDLGDEDIWTFMAYKNSPIKLTVQKISGAASFSPWMRLYGTDGTPLPNSTTTISYTPTNTGYFTLLVGSLNAGYTGSYRLIGTNISDGLRLLVPGLIGTNLNLPITGGGSNLQVILYSSTNLGQSLPWTPIRTNNFDAVGSFTFTNLYNPALREQYFRLSVP